AENPSLILGAGAWYGPILRDGRPALHAALRVPAPYRNRGVGAALLRSLVEGAIRRGAAELLARHDPDADPTAGPFLLRHGFVFEDRLTTFEAGQTGLATHLLGLRDWLLERGDVPSGARLVRPHEAPVDQVARLYARHLGGDAASRAAQL